MMKKYILVLFLILLSGFAMVAQTEVATNAHAVFMSKDSQGKMIINWTEKLKNDQFVLRYLELDAYGSQKSVVKTIQPTLGMQAHSESMAKVIRSGKGVLYAIFRIKSNDPKFRFGGHIYYTMSIDNGRSWSEKQRLVKIKDTKSQSFFDVAILPDGEVGMSWLDSRKSSKKVVGSSLYFAKTFKDKGFVKETPIASNTCQCCRTEIFVDNLAKTHIAFRNITKGSIRDMYKVSSNNDGVSFSKPHRMGRDNWQINGCPHTGPSLAVANKLAAVWYTGATSGSGIFFKKLEERPTVFESKTLLSTTGLHPQMAAIKGRGYYVVYEDFLSKTDPSLQQIILHTIDMNGVQKRNVISDMRYNSDHAVISSTKDNGVLVAWVTHKNKMATVQFKKIK